MQIASPANGKKVWTHKNEAAPSPLTRLFQSVLLLSHSELFRAHRGLVVLCLLGMGMGLGVPPALGQTSVTGNKVECTEGTAGQYPCENVDLLSFFSISDLGGASGVELNDVWGWTDSQTGTEYALVGRTDATAFVDVSTPTDPV